MNIVVSTVQHGTWRGGSAVCQSVLLITESCSHVSSAVIRCHVLICHNSSPCHERHHHHTGTHGPLVPTCHYNRWRNVLTHDLPLDMRHGGGECTYTALALDSFAWRSEIITLCFALSYSTLRLMTDEKMLCVAVAVDKMYQKLRWSK